VEAGRGVLMPESGETSERELRWIWVREQKGRFLARGETIKRVSLY
jgi:hypothetical protein